MTDLIKQIDSEIEKYYVKQGRNNYFDKDGNGLFYLYVVDAGFGDDDLDEELKEGNSNDCLLLEFDEEEFPFPKNIQDQDDKIKNEFIFDLIKKCAGMSKPKPKPKIKKDIFLMMNQFEITPQNLGIHRKLHMTQCPSEFIRPILNDETVFKFISIGAQVQCDYIQHLVDHYFRCQIANFKQPKQPKQATFGVAEWTKNHSHFQKLKDIKGDKFATDIKQAVVGYKTRIGCGLVLPPLNVFDDRLDETVYRFRDAIKFMDKIKKGENCPFQLDVCIVFKDMSESKKNEDAKNDDSKQEDDEDDDDDEDNFDIPATEAVDVGNIAEKLDDYKYVAEQYKGFDRLYKELKQETCRNKRFVTLLDRRNIGSQSEKIYMYEPPEDSNDIPTDAVSVKYFSNSVVCVIPSKGYELSPTWNGKSKDKLEVSKDKIGVKTAGPTMTLSFHVKEEDVVKLYVFVNGQYFRFMAEDLKDILPVFFVSNKSNEEFKNGDKIKELIKEIEPYLKDEQFTEFVEKHCN